MYSILIPPPPPMLPQLGRIPIMLARITLTSVFNFFIVVLHVGIRCRTKGTRCVLTVFRQGSP
jgi:hypothetical protein